ncbi:MAG: hypothetical protein HYZ40_16640 [Rhodospirillales bacterium]|nr:hypothetical protein [Rhodospirillales bacterium]
MILQAERAAAEAKLAGDGALVVDETLQNRLVDALFSFFNYVLEDCPFKNSS